MCVSFCNSHFYPKEGDVKDNGYLGRLLSPPKRLFLKKMGNNVMPLSSKAKSW